MAADRKRPEMAGDERRPSERRRVPQPLIRRRMPSGRGAMEQPNAIGDGVAALSARFWAMLVLTGVAAGLFGALMMLVLHTVQHLAFDYHSGVFQVAVERAGGTRRVIVLAIAGALGGVAWYILRRLTPGERSEIHGPLWESDGRLSSRRSFATSIISEIVVGMGASLGREAAPQLMGAVSGSVLGGWAGLSTEQRRLLLACGAGAGLAAVYNVPLGGALIAAELLYGRIELAVVLPALACSAIATVVSWIYLPTTPTYIDIPTYHLEGNEVVWALLAGPIIGLVAVVWVRMIGWVSAHRPAGRSLLVAPLCAFVVLGLVSIRYPQLLGNGKDMAHMVFLGHGAFLVLLALFVLKPLVTGMCLGSGATGGLFTPTMSTGAMLGGALGIAWSQIWPGAPIGAYALIGAAAMIGAAMQAPLAALVLMLELTQTSFGVAVPMILATSLATIVVRYVDGYSIYSARLPPQTT